MSVTKNIVFIIFALFRVLNSSAQHTDTTRNSSNEIVFTSDTQKPIWIESILLRPNHNREATRNIFDNLVKREPKAIFILGDVVSLGNSNKQWKRMDGYLKRLRAKGIYVNAALGNHDVMGQPVRAQQKFQKRFPAHVKTGSVQIFDSVAIVLLNSNFKNLTGDEDTAQVRWYRSTLNQLESNPAVQFIITGCHHSPFTNSKIVGASTLVKTNFVAPFMHSSKSRLFLSGHTHAFEHFRVEGKDFMVIGGGGGLHQPLKDRRPNFKDLAADYKPMFHYLSVLRNGQKLEVTSVRLKPDFSGFENGLRVEVSKTGESVVVPVAPNAETTSKGSF